jgi:hypothetical protein
MQLRCSFCQTMFAISREDMLAALERLADEKLKYYDAHCPKCRRANRVDHLKLELAYPNWKADIKTMAKAAASAEEKPAEPKPAPKVSKPAAAPASKVKAPAVKAKAPVAKVKAPAGKTKAPAAPKKTPAAAKKK